MVRFLSCFTLLALTLPAHAQDSGQTVDLLVTESMKQWQVPGLALVIVQDGRVVYLKSFGVKELGKPEPVTPDTLFPLASCTKPFTTLATAMLVDDGKLDWDDPVRKHVGYFHLADPLADAAVNLRDLATHRTGLAAYDLLWYGTPDDLETRIRKLEKLELARPFRTGFQYQTIAFGALGVAAGRAAESSWQDVVQRRVLDPLDMKGSAPTFRAGIQDAARGHRKNAAGKVEVIPRYPLEAPDPAGSVHSTTRDLANFLRFQLGDGAWQGRRLLSAETLTQMHQPQIVIPRSEYVRVMNPDSLFLHYGLGWIVQDYKGKLTLLHGGAIDGFRAHLTLVPEAKLGLALVNNLDRSFINLALSNCIVDHYLGLPTKDWSSYYFGVLEEERRMEAERVRALRAKMARSVGLVRPLAEYAGSYHDAAFGACAITVDNGRLRWSWNGRKGVLEHVDRDTFMTNQDSLVDVFFEFTPGSDGTLTNLRLFDRTFRKRP